MIPAVRLALALVIVIGASCLATLSLAQTPQQRFQVAARVTEGCLVGGGGGGAAEFGRLDFGTVSALSGAVLTSALVQTASLSLECTPGLSLTMRVDGGLNAEGGTRHLARSGGERLAYTLFTDAGLARSLSVDQPVSFALGAASSRVTLPLFARLALPESAAAGTYTDRLTVTLEW
ncbi:Csu type fimbrial protein [Salinicola aestuarinus]|uniref:Csu type fimbrial protein n=1 Tax=Salinicola aestuarinus TaxID=1949082 RepID=UPI000DA1DB0D|nr:spore coat U domain-containing protein [Salinicola aestuarinus]